MGNQKVTAAMVRREYRKLIRAFLAQIPDGQLALRVQLSVDHYFRRCAVCIWGQGSQITEDYVEVYNAIQTDGAKPGDALYFEVLSRVTDHPSFTAPVFYPQLQQCDEDYGTHLVRSFQGLTEALLLLFAAVDAQVTQREADYVEVCLSILREGKVDPAPKAPQAPVQSNAPDSAAQQKAAQSGQESTEPAEESAPPEETVEELLAQLDELCGLDQVKKDVHSMINLIKVRKLRQENGLPVPPMSLHLVFMGNPGTGKTTVARLIAKLYHAIGVLPKGQLVEVDRAGLVAGYVGQTAIKTQQVIDQAMGGVLFIDEAYSLTSQKGENDFGKEAIECLLKNMEDHRDQLIVIVAGYVDLMSQFICSNPGLESRFNKYFYFDDYNGSQLQQIFLSQCKKNGYQLDKATEEYAQAFFNRLYEERNANFGNARDVRNLFEALVASQADRVSQLEAPTVEDLMAVTLEDFKKAAEEDGEEGESTENLHQSETELAEDPAQPQPPQG
jgi:SpoVK/Ycf46/Vps4 family AAA+-type ATPase